MSRYSRVVVVVMLLSVPASRATGDPSLRLEAGATTSLTDELASTPGFILGGAVALTRWAPLPGIAFAPELGLLFAHRNASGLYNKGEPRSAALDVLELPLVLRGELTIGRRTFHVLGGGYASVLLRAQTRDDSGVVERVDTANSVELGWVAAGGFTLASFASGELSLEMRYQRGYQGFLLDDDRTPETLSLLLGYALRARKGDAPSAGNPHPSLALQGGLVATRLLPSALAAKSAPSEYRPGFSFGGSYSPFRLGSWIALLPAVELSFVRRNAAGTGPADGSLAMDSIDLALLARAELVASGRTYYGLGGLYGSLLVDAQQSGPDGRITDMSETMSAVDAGWIVGGGIELSSVAAVKPAIELRYQRGSRNLLPGEPPDRGEVTQQTVSCPVSLRYGGSWPAGGRETLPGALYSSHDQRATGKPSSSSSSSPPSSGPAPGGRTVSVTMGNPGDRWLDALSYRRIERATRDGKPGYEVEYDIEGHGQVVLFWPRHRIDLGGSARGSRMESMKLGKARLRYPQRITSRSLPRVHAGILEIEEAYAKQADGAIAALEGFAIVVALGELQPRLRSVPKSSRLSPAWRAGKGTNVKPKTTARGAAAAGQLHHAISRPIYRELQRHRGLRGVYKARDPRFVLRAADEAAHNGYQAWHRAIDDEVVAWLKQYKKATPAQFEAYLRSVYQRPGLRRLVPRGFE